jgi:hypothetical protein
MNVSELSIQELENLLKQIASASHLEHKHDLIRALQNKIAERHLEFYWETDLLSELLEVPLNILDQWYDEFSKQQTRIPPELYRAIELKKASQSTALLTTMIVARKQSQT